LVLSDYAADGAGRLRALLAADHGIELLIERRRRERRRRQRRAFAREMGNGRRVVRNSQGRRVAERRTPDVELATWPDGGKLPGRALGVRFVAVRAPNAQECRAAMSLGLVVRFQRGELAAVAELHALWSSRLQAYFERGLKDRHAAEDQVQQIAVILLDELRNYEIRPQVPFEGWLFSIARRRLASELRSRGRLEVWEPDRIAEHRERERLAPDVAERIERWALDGTLALLPERQRQVLTLRYMCDLDTAELAAALGITEQAVYKAEQRALQNLPRHLIQQPSARRVLRASMRRLDPGLPVLRARRLALMFT
jgi:RNA polymerase sigma-70 factor (ECF subfamily)